MRRGLDCGDRNPAFANRECFVADIRKGGIAAMELVARDLKALGLYTARALSFAGVEYEILEHRLTGEQIAVYDAYAGAWAIIHARFWATWGVTLRSRSSSTKSRASSPLSVQIRVTSTIELMPQPCRPTGRP